VFSKGADARKSSPVSMRDELEGERPLKLVTAHAKMEPSLPPQLMVEGMMKSLDTKFQIPKLSARSSNLNEGDSKKQSSDKTAIGSTEPGSRMDSGAKPLDLVGKGEASNASAKFQPLSKTTDDLKGSKISGIASVTPPIAISSLAAQTLKQPPTTTFPSVSSKLQDISTDTSVQISTPTSSAIVTSLPSVSSEPPSGESIEVSRMKPDLSRSTHISSNNAKEDTTIQAIGKLENPTKSFSANNNNDPSVISALHPNKSLDSSQNKFSSPSSQKQTEDSKKLVSLSDISSKSAGLNKMIPMPTTSQEAAEILLDMSASTSLPNKPLPTDPQPGKLATVPERAVAVSAPSRRNTPPPPLPPPQPSVQVHIVQSPAATPTTASPMVITSPHSASPCSIDDELMDEALVGMGK
jgi:mediator of RNA polymerase II transcription subunit 1